MGANRSTKVQSMLNYLPLSLTEVYQVYLSGILGILVNNNNTVLLIYYRIRYFDQLSLPAVSR